MKICLIGPASSVHLFRWAEGLSRSDLEVHVVTQHLPLKNFAKLPVKIHRLPVKGPVGYFLNRPFLEKLIRSMAPDVVHAHYASGYGALAAKLSHPRKILSVWGSDVQEFPERSSIHRALMRRWLNSYGVVTATSAFLAGVAQDAGLANRPEVVSFGVDCDRFNLGSRLTDRFSVLSLKALEKVYGQRTSLMAVSKFIARQDGNDCRMRFAGAGPQKEFLQHFASSLEIADRCEFLEEVPHDEVPSLLQSSDLLLNLSERESFGVSVLEAMACGIPVIATQVGGLPELVMQGETGFLVKVGDSSRAAECMEILFKDPILRKKMGETARKRAVELFSWDSSLRKMIAIYRR